MQLLDGVGAGIFGALFPVIVEDLTQGTGRFNVTQGAIATAQGTGAALSTAVAGAIVVSAGYGAAFATLGGVALVGLPGLPVRHAGNPHFAGRGPQDGSGRCAAPA